ncbi:hypothetical protein Bca101_097565 [Brassica carinata]
MGDPRVQSRKLRVELKVHEPKWINYGHFTRPRKLNSFLLSSKSCLVGNILTIKSGLSISVLSCGNPIAWNKMCNGDPCFLNICG